MAVISLACSSCGAPIQVPPDLDQFACVHCGTALLVQRGEGYVALKVAEHLTRTISDSAARTQQAIAIGTTVTQAELRRLQITQEIATATNQLGNIQAQIRYLNSSKQTRNVKRQLADLQRAESGTIQRMNTLQDALSSTSTDGSTLKSNQAPQRAQQGQRLPRPSEPFTKSPAKMGCATLIALIILVSLLANATGASEIDQTNDTVLGVGIFLAVVAAIFVATRVAAIADRPAKKPGHAVVKIIEPESVSETAAQSSQAPSSSDRIS